MMDEYRIVNDEPDSGMGGPGLVMIYRGDVCVKGNIYRREAVAWIAERSHFSDRRLPSPVSAPHPKEK